MYKNIYTLLEQTVSHKTYGKMKIISIVSEDKGIIEAKQINDDITRKFILSPEFFYNIEGYKDYSKRKYYGYEHRTSNKKHLDNLKTKRNKFRDRYFLKDDEKASKADRLFEIGNYDSELYHSNYNCENCSYECSSYLDLSACPNCGSDEFYDIS